jgi:nucleotidyltransferase/DNA polymerase involved in DNA repair
MFANGQDDRPVVADRVRKSSGSETTFERDLIASAEIEAGVEAMADDVWAWCDKAKAFGWTVTVKVRFADFRRACRRRRQDVKRVVVDIGHRLLSLDVVFRADIPHRRLRPTARPEAPTKDRLIGKIMGGNPAFRGTRVPVHLLAELVPSRVRAHVWTEGKCRVRAPEQRIVIGTVT